IVVVEAVQAKFDEGYRSPVLAADDAMKGVSSAILTSTIIFMAVFIPVAMMGGTSGAFYSQFGITMAVAVGISAINAFTLSPALCALLLRPYTDEHGNPKDNFAARFRKAFNAVFNRFSNRYVRGVLYFMHHRRMVWGAVAGTIVLLVVLIGNLAGTALPLLARALHIDPAIMSGPFITTVVDIVGLIVYFETAGAVLGLSSANL
ncbi:MAG: efflux RND transporter permease subunit, partial [Pyramidobacter sp.]|nr:efflux RND transporter permease subunit [Pyramidobacter sp.]